MKLYESAEQQHTHNTFMNTVFDTEYSKIH